MTVERLSAGDVARHHTSLVALLCDAVDGGASVSFLPPLSTTEADMYWQEVAEAVAGGHRVLLTVRDGEGVVGSVQLDLARVPNGRHRAEVLKLLVHRRARRQGLGTMLMQAIEEEARALGRSLLVLDTRQGDAAETLYRRLGYQEAGVIPRYALNATGGRDATVLFYKEL